MSSYLTADQVDHLLKPIKAHRVGKDGRGYSHVEAYDIRAHLTRMFGFARWSADLTDLALIFESEVVEGSRSKWTVAYRATVRLTVCAPDGTQLATYTEAASGDAANQPHRSDAHDLAIKTAESQAFKRCAANLGSGFGLSLYAKGSLSDVVVATLVHPGREKAAAVDDVPPVVSESEAAPEPAPTPVAPAPEAPLPASPSDEARGEVTTADAESLREQVLSASTAAQVTKVMLAVGKARLGEAQVADEQGEVITLSVLASRQLNRLTQRQRKAAAS